MQQAQLELHNKKKAQAKPNKKPTPSEEDKKLNARRNKLQQTAQNLVMQGKQDTIEELSKKEHDRQLKNYKNRQKTVDKKLSNFYVLDTETNGFPLDGGTNEPIQIVALPGTNQSYDL